MDGNGQINRQTHMSFTATCLTDNTVPVLVANQPKLTTTQWQVAADWFALINGISVFHLLHGFIFVRWDIVVARTGNIVTLYDQCHHQFYTKEQTTNLTMIRFNKINYDCHYYYRMDSHILLLWLWQVFFCLLSLSQTN